MDASGWVLLAVIALLLLTLGAIWVSRRRQSQRLEDHYGREYDRTLQEAHSRREAENELLERERRREHLDIHELDPTSQSRYRDEWQELQQRFVDEPRGAVVDADRLVTSVMRDRGYPVEDFEQRAADISVDHPEVVSDYRTAHDIALRVREDRASTEDLRQAVVHYRSLFDQLLNGREPAR
jgi:FtsZ-interacting cell division protein ZipA